MLRQALSTSSRALRPLPRLAAAVPRPLLRPLALPARAAAQPAAVARWYSDAKETPAEGQGDKAEAQGDKAQGDRAQGDRAQGDRAQGDKAEAKGDEAEPDALSELKKALETKENEVKEWKDKCLRSIADFRNLQDRTQREVKTARDFAIQKFAKDLVDSVDNLDRALTTVPADKINAPEKTEHLQDLANLYDGLKMTETILLQTLAKHGLERLDPNGAKFDPNEHEATFTAPQPDKENNTVFHVQQKGFKLNGRVLRAAKVGIVKNN